jgi:hypothetical protein
VPTIPLYDSPLNPDAWHRVRSPGGYEWWHFDAQDAQHDRQLVATFYDGYIFDPDYRHRYASYLRKPTQNPPPLPSEFSCVHFAMYENGRSRFEKYLPAARFIGSQDSPALKIGKNFIEAINNHPRLSLLDQSFSAEVSFKPVFLGDPVLKTIDANHHWIVSNPLCDVEATIELDGETIHFRGRGFGDHQFGASPPMQKSIHGRVLLDDAMCAFHISQDAILVEAGASGIEQAQIERIVRDPRKIQLDDLLSLSNPRVLDATWLIYDAIWRGRAAMALCTINRPRD